MEKRAIVVVINSLLVYDYVGGREGINPDLYKVRTSSICSLVLWPQVGYLWIYKMQCILVHLCMVGFSYFCI